MRGRQVSYYVRPRFSPGSPSLVNVSTAARVGNDERAGYKHALEGVYGAEQKQRAVALGLSGIVEQWTEDSRGNVSILDLVTGEAFTVTSAQRDLLRELKADARRHVEVIAGTSGEVAFVAGPLCHRKVKASDVRALVEAKRLRLTATEGRCERFCEWSRWQGEEVANAA